MVYPSAKGYFKGQCQYQIIIIVMPLNRQLVRRVKEFSKREDNAL